MMPKFFTMFSSAERMSVLYIKPSSDANRICRFNEDDVFSVTSIIEDQTSLVFKSKVGNYVVMASVREVMEAIGKAE